MSLFHHGEIESYVGVDIGNSGIKIVELQNDKKRPQLLTYGYIEQNNEIIQKNTPEAKEKIVDALTKVWEAAHVQSRKVIASLPSYTVFSSIIHLPPMKKRELAQAVEWEAKKFVPLPLSEMVLDWKILDEKVFRSSFVSSQVAGAENASQGVIGNAMQAMENMLPGQKVDLIQSKERSFYKILLTAAPRDIIARYVEVFQMAKLELVGIETESFAAERSLVGNDPHPIMMIDMGAVATNFSIVVDGVPIINRSIDIAGNTMTQAIANSLNIPAEQAEQLKRDFGLASTQEGQAITIPRHLDTLMAAVMTEIHYVLNLYQNQTNGPIDKIVLTGGSAWLPHIADYISGKIGVKVFVGDPWARVTYPEELRDVLTEIGPRLSVAIGLAMRNIVSSQTAPVKENEK